MKVLFAVSAVLALACLASADDCENVCGFSCTVGNQVCMLQPADIFCNVAKLTCQGVCKSACACLSECITKCPDAELATGGAAIISNVVGIATTAACRTTCRGACGFSVGTETAGQAVDIVTKMIAAIVGIEVEGPK